MYKNNVNIDCNYHIEADEREFARIALKIDDINFAGDEESCTQCWKNNEIDKLEVLDTKYSINFTDSCFSKCSKKYKSPLYSSGSKLSLRMHIDGRMARLNYYKQKSPIFKASYKFLHPPVCGVTNFKAKKNGFMTFPSLQNAGFKIENVECLWDVQIPLKTTVQFQVSYMNN